MGKKDKNSVNLDCVIEIMGNVLGTMFFTLLSTALVFVYIIMKNSNCDIKDIISTLIFVIMWRWEEKLYELFFGNSRDDKRLNVKEKKVCKFISLVGIIIAMIILQIQDNKVNFIDVAEEAIIIGIGIYVAIDNIYKRGRWKNIIYSIFDDFRGARKNRIAISVLTMISMIYLWLDGTYRKIYLGVICICIIIYKYKKEGKRYMKKGRKNINLIIQLEELLNKLDLPKKYYNSDFDIVKKYEEEIEKFENLVLKIDDNSKIIQEKLQRAIFLIRQSKQHILKVFDYYECSNPKCAQEEFDSMMNSIKEYFFIATIDDRVLIKDGVRQIIRRNSGKRFYRVRPVAEKSDSIKNNADELFHIPINKRAYTSSERFSLGGFPSLYLSTVLPLAWQECGYPQKYYYSEYQYDKMSNETRNYEDELKFFALYSPKEIYEWGISMKFNDFEVWLEFVIRYLILYPLVIGCSFVNHGGKVSYKQEYIIPQMLMQWVQRNNEIVQGVSYFTCLDIEMMPKEYCGYNLAIPIMKPYDEKNYSERLRKEFIWTMPQYYQIPLLDLKQNKEDGKLLYDFIEEIHKIYRSYIIPERLREYISEIERICVCLYQIMKNGNDSNIQMIIHTLNLIDTSCDQLRQQSFDDIVQEIEKKHKKMSQKNLKKMIEESKRCVERFWNVSKECEGIGYIIEKYSHTTWNDFAQLSIIKILYRNTEDIGYLTTWLHDNHILYFKKILDDEAEKELNKKVEDIVTPVVHKINNISPYMENVKVSEYTREGFDVKEHGKELLSVMK